MVNDDPSLQLLSELQDTIPTQTASRPTPRPLPHSPPPTVTHAINNHISPPRLVNPFNARLIIGPRDPNWTRPPTLRPPRPRRNDRDGYQTHEHGVGYAGQFGASSSSERGCPHACVDEEVLVGGDSDEEVGQVGYEEVAGGYELGGEEREGNGGWSDGDGSWDGGWGGCSGSGEEEDSDGEERMEVENGEGIEDEEGEEAGDEHQGFEENEEVEEDEEIAQEEMSEGDQIEDEQMEDDQMEDDDHMEDDQGYLGDEQLEGQVDFPEDSYMNDQEEILDDDQQEEQDRDQEDDQEDEQEAELEDEQEDDQEDDQEDEQEVEQEDDQEDEQEDEQEYEQEVEQEVEMEDDQEDEMGHEQEDVDQNPEAEHAYQDGSAETQSNQEDDGARLVPMDSPAEPLDDRPAEVFDDMDDHRHGAEGTHENNDKALEKRSPKTPGVPQEPVEVPALPVIEISKQQKADKALHAKAASLIPHKLGVGRYWIAVLHHTVKQKDARKEKDFLWIMAHRRTTVETVWHTYQNATTEDQFQLFTHDERPEFEDVLEELDFYNDKLVVFRAVVRSPLLQKGFADAPIMIDDD